jgi:hypothetical protein
MAEAPTDPAGVWRLIERADELMKYASNRDPAAARAQALETLHRAEEALAGLTDPKAAAALGAQIRKRFGDLEGAS